MQPGGGGTGSDRRKKHLCGHALLLLWVISMCCWLLFVGSNSSHHLVYNGIRSRVTSVHHDSYNGMVIRNRTFLHQMGDPHQFHQNVGNLVSEKIERNQTYRNGSVIRTASSHPQQHEDGGRKEDGDEPSHIFLPQKGKTSTCATVEEMGAAVSDQTENASLRVRKMIQDHFAQHGAGRVRDLPPEQFCRQNFVFGRASEAGFGNEMYKILTAAALSLMLNRSLIIGETREKLPFGDYIAYSNESFSLKEVKLLWARNDCTRKHKRPLVMRMDDFQRPTRTGVLCEDWREWKQPVIWFQGTTDTVAIQFFLKNGHPGMRATASLLFGDPKIPSSRPNLFGELMKVIISPTYAVKEAVNWVLNGGPNPDITLHMRMRTSRSRRALHAAFNCIKKSLLEVSHKNTRPRVVLVSDTPSIVEHIKQKMEEYAEVLQFDYMSYTKQNVNKIMNASYYQPSETRARDWGPMPRWVAFVDFFLASRATHAVVSGAHRRVGTTYAQLIAALAAAHKLDENLTSPLNFSFYSSFQNTLLADGLANQIGWGHVWNRFGGKLSCHNQTDQCALTPLLPYGWWEGPWQSPIPRDIRRLKTYGVYLKDTGELVEKSLQSFCESMKASVKTLTLQLPSCKNNCMKQ
eukprot:Gb_39654 [translate_table: standard]